MNILITLNEEAVKGLKEYLKEVGGIDKPTKRDVEIEIKGYIAATLSNPNEAVSDYINKYLK